MKPKLGLPYKGSKRAIASSLIDTILFYKPTAKYFVDLFGGGGAMSLEALRKRRFLKVFYNEINAEVGCLFEACVMGNLQKKLGKDYLRFVDCYRFFQSKHETSIYSHFVKLVYSFANDRRNYLYSTGAVHWKEKAHNFIINLDASGLEWFIEQTGCVGIRDFANIFKGLSWHRRRELWRNALLKAECIKLSGLGEIDNYFYKLRGEDLIKVSQAVIHDAIIEHCSDLRLKVYHDGEGNAIDRKRIDKLEGLDFYNTLEHLERIEHLERMQGIEGMKIDSHFLEFSQSDYKDFKISTPIEETIIYCDPPYMNTSGYQNDFDSLEFFEWAKKHDYGIFISEYSNPLGLEQVLSLGKREQVSQAKTKKQEVLLWNGR